MVVKADEAMEGLEAVVAAEGVGDGGFDGAGALTVGVAEGGGEGAFDGAGKWPVGVAEEVRDGAFDGAGEWTVGVSEGVGGWGDGGNAGGVAIADRMGEMVFGCEGAFGW